MRKSQNILTVNSVTKPLLVSWNDLSICIKLCVWLIQTFTFFRKLYWSDWNRIEPKIEESSLNGKDRRVLVSQGLGLPNALTIDFTENNICWSDAGVEAKEIGERPDVLQNNLIIL